MKRNVDVKTIGQLIDELSIVNNKIWHLVDKAMAGDGEAAIKAQRANELRSYLITAIDNRLEPGGSETVGKVYSE